MPEPSCENCANYLKIENILPLCNRTRRPSLSVISEGVTYNYCEFERRSDNNCGPFGRFYKAREKVLIQEAS